MKTGIRRASGDFVLIIDADGQHPPEDAQRIVAQARRIRPRDRRARRGDAGDGRAARRQRAAQQDLASYLTSRPIPDLTSGFRGARTECLREFLHLLPNGFSTPTTTTLAFIKAGYNVTFEPIDARQRSRRTRRSASRRTARRFLLILLKIVTLFSPLRIFLPISVVSFVTGAIYGIWNMRLTHGQIPNGAVLLILFAVIVFLVGLVSEQIASLRFEGPRTRRACGRWSSSHLQRARQPAALVERLLPIRRAPRADRRRCVAGRHGSRSPTGYAAANRARVQVLHRTGKRGLGLSYIDGMSAALRPDATHICQMDADLSHNPADVPRLLHAAEHADFVDRVALRARRTHRELAAAST